MVRVGARATSMAETGRGWLRIFGGHCRAPGPDLPSFPRRHTDVTERSLGLAWTSPTLDACRTGRAPSRRSRLGPPAPRRLMRLLTAVHLDRPPGEGLLEASGDTAVGQDTEEWAPLQFFARSRSTPTFFLRPRRRARSSRTVEAARAATAIGRRVVAGAPASATASLRAAEACALPLADGVEEMFSPATAASPGLAVRRVPGGGARRVVLPPDGAAVASRASAGFAPGRRGTRSGVDPG